MRKTFCGFGVLLEFWKEKRLPFCFGVGNAYLSLLIGILLFEESLIPD